MRRLQGSKNVTEFMEHGTKELLGSEMIVDLDAKALAERVVADLKEKRKKLGWDQLAGVRRNEKKNRQRKESVRSDCFCVAGLQRGLL